VADDIVLNPGVGGATVGADLIGGVDYQRIKLIHGADGVNDGDVAKTNPLPIAQYPVTAGGGSDYHKVSAASTNAASVKGAAGQVYGIKGINIAQYPVYVKLFDKATAPTPGVDTPVRTVPLQAGVRCDDVIPNGMALRSGSGSRS
jgi:hypothetical protein